MSMESASERGRPDLPIRAYAWLNRLSPVVVLAAGPAFAGQNLAEEATIVAMASIVVVDAIVLRAALMVNRVVVVTLVCAVLACLPLAASLYEYYWLDTSELGDWMDPAKYLVFGASLVCAFVVEASITKGLLAQREAASKFTWRYTADKLLLAATSYPRIASAQFFERRALQMRSRSLAILSLIVVLIIGGVATIFLAGNIVSTDAKGASQLEKINSIIADYENKVAELDDSLNTDQSKLQTDILQAQKLGYQIDTSTTPLGIKPPSTNLNETEQSKAEELLRNIAGLAYGIERDKIRFEDLRQTLASLEADLKTHINDYTTDPKSNETDVSLLVASGVTRFGVLFVVIFLVQILLQVYRYSMRLATFYHARADGLLLAPPTSTELGAWGDQLLPAADFGRLPTPPSEYWTKIIEAILGKKSEAEKPSGSNAEAQAAQVGG